MTYLLAHVSVAGSIHVALTPTAVCIVEFINCVVVDGGASEVELALIKRSCSEMCVIHF